MAIDSVAMDALLLRFETARAAATGASSRVQGAGMGKPAQGAAMTGGVDFGAVLRKSLDQVDQMQGAAAKLADRFQLDDPAVSLEDTMVALQKANVTFQAALQVRNKVVAAYNDIMNMQI